MKPGDEHEISVQIVNDSEVAVSCKVIVENLTTNLPLIIASDPTDDEIKQLEPAPMTEITVVSISPGETADANVSLIWKKEYSSETNMGKTDALRITLIVEQID